jgi:hypothetical protein
VLINFYTSLVVIRLAGSNRANASLFQVILLVLIVALASRSSSIKLAVVSCVFIGGGSGPPRGRSIISPRLAPSTPQQFYINSLSLRIQCYPFA